MTPLPSSSSSNSDARSQWTDNQLESRSCRCDGLVDRVLNSTPVILSTTPIMFSVSHMINRNNGSDPMKNSIWPTTGNDLFVRITIAMKPPDDHE